MINKIISWNVRDLNYSKKRNIIKGCTNRWKPDLIYLQETKMAFINKITVNSAWGLQDTDWLYLLTDKTAGGILIYWKSDILACTDYIKGKISISYLFVNKKNKEKWSFFGIYYRGNASHREKL